MEQQQLLQGEEQDRPPFVEICVGRERERLQLRNSKAKVMFLTGIGGSGKSTLAARFFTEVQDHQEFSLYVWRDCKEESERFENQLAAVIEKLSAGRISADELAKQSAKAVIQVLMSMIEGMPVLFVFDNADHYVDLESQKMSGSANIFIKALTQSATPSRVVFTCRPSISYDDPLVLTQRLEGLDIESAVELFSERHATSTKREIEDAHRLTEGHAFWLDLLAIQVARANSGTSLAALTSQIGSGRGLLPEKTLKSIWATLKPREQLVLRALAETVKPATEVELGEYLRHEISYNKVMKAVSALKALNLVVVKRLPTAPDVMELHPLVREFVRQNFSPIERRFFIVAIIKVYERFMGSHKQELLKRPPLSLLQYWTQNAELDLEAGRFSEAFATLAEAGAAFLASAYPREFCRVARLLLSRVDWVKHHVKFSAFESVFWSYVRHLCYLGEYEEGDRLLDQYAATFAGKDSRYINYCEMRCFANWVRGSFATALEWGWEGKKLKESVDTTYQIDLSLALALRDAGHPEVALPIFLQGRQLKDVLNPDVLHDYTTEGYQLAGAYYGNIGRCLYFMGQIDSALVCYQKSALLIEQKTNLEHVLNQGFIRYWIGEILVAREELRLAGAFLRAAYLKWREVCPPRASQVDAFFKQTRSRIDGPPYPEDMDVEKICLDWILGRRVEIAKA